MKTPANDLNSLIHAAETEATRAETRLAVGPAARPGARRALLVTGTAAASLAIGAIQLWPLVRGHSADQTTRDLEAIVDQTREAVEAVRMAQGRLPDALPNAALAGLVAYTPAGNVYQLFAASGGVSVTLGPDGKKTVTRGQQP